MAYQSEHYNNKEEFYKFHIDQLIGTEKFNRYHKVSRNILNVERKDFFAHLEETFIGPLAGLVLKTTSNRIVAKVILWFLYPKYHMGNEANAAWEAMDKRIFGAVQEEEEDVEVALRLN